MTVGRDSAADAIAAVHGRIGLVMGVNEQSHRDTCTAVEVPNVAKGEIGSAAGTEVSGETGKLPAPHVLSVTPVVGKVDILFPDFTREQRLALRMDRVAMFSVTDQCVVSRALTSVPLPGLRNMGYFRLWRRVCTTQLPTAVAVWRPGTLRIGSQSFCGPSLRWAHSDRTA